MTKPILIAEPLAIFLFAFGLMCPPIAGGAAPARAARKASREIDLSASVVEGQIKRPELTVVTADAETQREGLLRFPRDFNDRWAAENEEETTK